MSDALKLQVGLDWRSAKIEHAREVRDLLGGNYFINYNDANHPNGVQTGLGGIIDYHNNTTVDWTGFFVEDTWVFGYGMDDKHGMRRGLPYITD